MSLLLRLPRKMYLCRSSSNVPCLPSFLEMPQKSHVLLTFDKVHNPLRLPRKTTRRFNVQKWTGMRCFVHVDLEMCFAPQLRALFRNLNRSHFGSRYTLGSCCKAGLLPLYFFHVAAHGTLTQLRPKILLSPVCCFEGPRDKYLFAAHRLFKTYAAPWKNKKKNNSRCSTPAGSW